MRHPVAESPTAPFGVRLALIALLPVIAALLYLEGQDFDPGLLQLRPGSSASPGPFPKQLAALPMTGPARRYDKDNLYEYINGHAEHFIGAGFQGLSVGEYGMDAEGQPQVVINLYDMGTPINAFGLLVGEAGERKSADVGALGFTTGKGVSFIQGPYYVQLSLFDPALPALDLARELASKLPAQTENTDLAFSFPRLGEVVETRFIREYYRGIDFLNNVLERTFDRDGQKLDAFLITGTEDRIRALAGALANFLSAEGIAFRTLDRQGLQFHAVEDPYEGNWFFVALPGRLLGVFAPFDDALVEEIRRFGQPTRTEPSTGPSETAR